MAESEEAPHNQQQPAAKMTQNDKKLHKEEEEEQGRGRYGAYGDDRRRRGVCAFIVMFLVLAGITALVVWLVYRPHKPKFRVVSAVVYELNLTGSSSSSLISTTMQFTVVTRNPNKRVLFIYDQLSAFVSYRNQAITPPVLLPPLFHETKSTVALSPVLGGGGIAVPVGAELAMEEASYGVVDLRLVLTGKLRYKTAGGINIRSGRHGILVSCDLLVGLKRGFVGQLPLLRSPPCTVHV